MKTSKILLNLGIAQLAFGIATSALAANPVVKWESVDARNVGEAFTCTILSDGKIAVARGTESWSPVAVKSQFDVAQAQAMIADAAKSDLVREFEIDPAAATMTDAQYKRLVRGSTVFTGYTTSGEAVVIQKSVNVPKANGTSSQVIGYRAAQSRVLVEQNAKRACTAALVANLAME